jgi:hypothetical protein
MQSDRSAVVLSLLSQVNKIREVPHHESVLVTHTDQAEVFVWSLERQPNRASDKVSYLRQPTSVT